MASDRDAVSWRMRPGAWDERGFLSASEELDERMVADTETCTRLGTTPEALGKRLLGLLAEGRARPELEHATDDDHGDEHEDEDEPAHDLVDPTDDAPDDVVTAPDEDEASVLEPRVTIRGGDAAVTCPWALEQNEVCLRGPGGAPSADRFTIVLGDDVLEGFTLSAHLIACHRFFGGLESYFRIDPVRALAVLDPG